MKSTTAAVVSVLIALLFLPRPTLVAQKTLTAKYIESEIALDGRLDETVWQNADVTDDFWQFQPNDSIMATDKTEIRVVYNDRFLYVGIRAYSNDPDYVVSTLKRDFRGTSNDNVTLLFDTFNDGANAYAFGVTPYGVRREILVSDGGASRGGYNSTWDVKWEAESYLHDDHYSVEMAIPFTSIKFIEGGTRWRFRPYRWNIQTNETSTWARVPQTQLLGNLAFMGELVFERPLGKSRTPVALIPYVNALAQRDFDRPDAETDLQIGGDAKIAVGDGMNLDLTGNPDFSNVEVDDIFTNLTRFEVFLPEKRQFFIDNGDLFAAFGHTFNEARPFFSRRIGLARDTAGNLIQNRILAGARLSGKLDENWRLGVLNIQTAADRDNEIAANNNFMIALQRRVASRSTVGAFLVNRQTFGDFDFQPDTDRYNRVVGADYNLASADNVWSGRVYLHRSFGPEGQPGDWSTQAQFNYITRDWVVIHDFSYIGADFRADLGFVPRRDIFKSGTSIQRFFYPKNRSTLNRYSARLISLNYWRPALDFKFADNFVVARLGAEFRDQSEVNLGVRRDFIFLFNPFDPTRTPDAEQLPGNEGYTFYQVSANYESNLTRLLTYSTDVSIGQFFNGNRYSFGLDLGYRIQPYVQFSLGVNYDGIRLPNPYADADLWLVTPRIDITFNRSLFWSTLLQYGSQQQNFGIQSRLQWRFAPLSDVFLVYNDNYRTEGFVPRFRSINLKVTYWLAL